MTGAIQGRVYRDRDGDLWLDPGDGTLLALDEPVLRRLREKWPSRPKDEIEEEFGPLREQADGPLPAPRGHAPGWEPA